MIGIIGGKGKMGVYFADFFKEKGYKVIVSDLGSKLSNIEVAQKADVVVVSVPIEHTVKVIKEVAPHVKADGLLMDLTSVKVEPVKAMLKSKASVIGCHPMFGPTNTIKNQIIVLSPLRGKKWYAWLKNILLESGAIVKEVTPEKHDELMTVIQGITHFTDITLAHTLAQSGIPLKTFLNYQSPAYRLKLDMMGRILYQDAGLYGNIQIQNAKTPKILKQYLKSVKSLIKIIKRKNLEKFIHYFNEGGDYLGDFKEKAQKESDLLIEFLNQQNSKLQKKDSREKIKKNCQLVTLGPAGSYSDIVSQKFMRAEKISGEVCYAKKIAEVFELVKSGQIKQGIVPIENKIEGSVRETMDALFKTNLKISQKLILPIQHCLAILPQTKKSEIQTIFSHEQPLHQCSDYIKKNFPQATIQPVSSTSEAMSLLIKNNLKNAAAIGSEETAQKMGLKIFAKNIGNTKENETHFYVIQKSSKQLSSIVSDLHQTSIAFYFDADTHGTLFGTLELFAKNKVNLSRIESRPAGKQMGNYIFYLDFDAGISEKKIITLLKNLEKKVSKLKILGSYSKIKI